MSNVHRDMAKSSLQTHSNQAPNLKFQLMALYLFLYKEPGSETLESEREMFFAHLSLPFLCQDDCKQSSFLPEEDWGRAS